MKLERSNIEFPIWRKKVDKSLFEDSGTTVPEWACHMSRVEFNVKKLPERDRLLDIGATLESAL